MTGSYDANHNFIMAKNVVEGYNLEPIRLFDSGGGAANSGGSGKEIYDGFMFVAGLKATGASLLLDSRLATLNMYRPIMTTGGRTLYGGTSLYSSTLKLSQGVKGVGFGLAGLGVLYDYTIGIQRYNKYGANDPWAVSPNKAAVNTEVTAWSLFVSPPVGVLYFGIDAFYPGGWPEAMRVYTSEHKLYREIYGDRYSIDAIMKF